ncbi:MAG: DUF488 domain-containing protein [Burkholderiales bacterium]|nr:DUF488 domain-containing protein [Burkholderiales bacterium]
MPITTYSVGHGNRSLEEFIALLGLIRLLVDVRAYPTSRRHPHFSREPLSRALADNGIEYAWQGKELGGLRKPSRESVNTGLNNLSFRAYADHMASPGFAAAIDELLISAEHAPLAVMCAERLPWQCHRYLISDYLMVRGLSVIHLLALDKSQPHRLNPLVRVVDGKLIYDRGVQIDLVPPSG